MQSDILSRLSVLLVDDVTFSRQTVYKMLTNMGAAEVHHAENGDQALDILQGNQVVDFILSDFKMPVFNGLQLLKTIRTGKAGASPEMPFVMVTGYSDRHLVDMALALDVNAFIAKPVSKQTLSARLEKMLSPGGGRMLFKKTEVYENVTIEEAEKKAFVSPALPARRGSKLKNQTVTRQIVGGMSSLKGKFSESDIARNITNGIDRLVSHANGEEASRVVSFIDNLVSNGILELEDIPDVLDAREAGPEGPHAPAKRKKVEGIWAVANDGMGEEKAYRLEDVPLGGVLSQDIMAKDGSLFIKKGISMTQQIIAILAHLHKVKAINLASMENEEPPGVMANFSPSPENDGSTMAFDSEGPPSNRLTHAVRGGTGWEKPVSAANEIVEGAVLTRDIYTTDGRLYMYAGSELTQKTISILRDLEELGNLKTKIWIAV